MQRGERGEGREDGVTESRRRGERNRSEHEDRGEREGGMDGWREGGRKGGRDREGEEESRRLQPFKPVHEGGRLPEQQRHHHHHQQQQQQDDDHHHHHHQQQQQQQQHPQQDHHHRHHEEEDEEQEQQEPQHRYGESERRRPERGDAHGERGARVRDPFASDARSEAAHSHQSKKEVVWGPTDEKEMDPEVFPHNPRTQEAPPSFRAVPMACRVLTRAGFPCQEDELDGAARAVAEVCLPLCCGCSR
eukprot:3789297-Rhodomonas_salina.7